MVKRVERLGRVARIWADSWRNSPDVPESTLIMVELAVDAADMADRARIDGDARLYLATASRLQQLIGSVDRGRDGRAGAGVDDGSGDAWSAALAELVGSGPEVGDSAGS